MSEMQSVYYPQSEIHTTLIPVTTGCPYNRCAFCSMYKADTYREVPLPEMELMKKGHTAAAAVRQGQKLNEAKLPFCACKDHYHESDSICIDRTGRDGERGKIYRGNDAGETPGVKNADQRTIYEETGGDRYDSYNEFNENDRQASGRRREIAGSDRCAACRITKDI